MWEKFVTKMLVFVAYVLTWANVDARPAIPIRSRATTASSPPNHEGLIVSTLAELRQYSDVASLKSALHQLCSEFGRITRLDILTAMHEGTKQAICFLRMEQPDQEQVLMKSLGVGRFGGEVVFVLNLNVPVTAEDGPSSQWADSDIY
eukprot:TRINITY_DN12678_c0_g1_i1.p1 TRINITY_DN12678_c0_g1~~TRINITY_DN12678_c0_g1_i1.p1  ORF type:complete len:148 (+),score=25.53 TRINITY_DN12678_c0_g1_i1:138-581(+)